MSPWLSATMLTDVYRQALQADPLYQIATQDYLTARENIPLAQAALLPDVDAVGTVDRTRHDRKRPSSVSTTTSKVFALSFSQPLFNGALWRDLAAAKASVRSARATYENASQDLIIRTAQAYFAVLEAHDVLRFSQSQTRTLLMQKRQTQARYDVGLDALTDVQEVNARYHSAVADELAAANALSDALENLYVMTHQRYTILGSLPANGDIPLVAPQPASIDAWVGQAMTHNQRLVAAQADAAEAHEALLSARADRWPVVSATGSYTYTHHTDTTVSTYSESAVPEVGLNVTLPVYAGGGLSAAVRQAAHAEASAQAQLLQVRRDIENQTRQSYFDVFSGVSQIRATRQAVVAGETALKAMQAAYGVGTRDLTDVLIAQSTLYAAQKDDAQQHYAYLMSLLLLKQSAGVLAIEDLEHLSHWLTQSIAVPQEMVERMMVTAFESDEAQEGMHADDLKPEGESGEDGLPSDKAASAGMPGAGEEAVSLPAPSSSSQIELPVPKTLGLADHDQASFVYLPVPMLSARHLGHDHHA